MVKQMNREPDKFFRNLDDMANKPIPETLTDEKWQAIINNDASFDGQFFYAVKTTGIFCRPSCKSRPPKKENISLFHTAEQALFVKFRPCKRCKPTGQRLPDDEWVALVKEYIEKNYMENLTLSILADICHGSPYHLHRTFKRVNGSTLVEYIQQKRIEQAKELLITTKKAIADVGTSVGLSNTPYFITLFKKKTGYTPAGHRQIQIQNMRGDSKMGNKTNSPIYWTLLTHGDWNMHIAATSEGLCYVGSQNQPFGELADWANIRFSGSTLIQNDEKLQPYAAELIEYLQGTRKSFTGPFAFHGTPFQLAVWNALCDIPYGQTKSYSDIANQIQKPAAVRAVGTAIGANPVLITVPCHRVIGKNGTLTGYRGGIAMKTKLLQLERDGVFVEGGLQHA